MVVDIFDEIKKSPSTVLTIKQPQRQNVQYFIEKSLKIRYNLITKKFYGGVAYVW